jgi:chromosome segregation ATPase
MLPPSFLALALTPAVEALALILSSAGVVKLFDIGYQALRNRRLKKLKESATHVSQAAEVKRIGIEEVDVVLDSMRDEITRLNQSNKNCHEEHERCGVQINQLTIDNLRLIARSTQYEFQINHLQRQAGLEETNFGQKDDEPKKETPDPR